MWKYADRDVQGEMRREREKGVDLRRGSGAEREGCRGTERGADGAKRCGAVQRERGAEGREMCTRERER